MCKRGTHTRPAMHLSCSATTSGSHDTSRHFNGYSMLKKMFINDGEEILR